MSRELLLLRHAKSSWDTGLGDFERPLAGRGRRDAPRMGEWLRGRGVVPDHIRSSPARRAEETAGMVCDGLAVSRDSIEFDERIYMADRATLLGVLARVPSDASRVLLVGHNPGMDDLLIHLCGTSLPRTASGKLMTTAALAHVELPDEWDRLPAGCGRLIELMRPRELGGVNSMGQG